MYESQPQGGEEVYLSELISTWDTLHQKDTGDVTFCDLVLALEKAGVQIVDDCVPSANELEDVLAKAAEPKRLKQARKKA